MDGSYDDDFSKIALAVTAAQLAKVNSVKEFGIGEDLTFNFFGWRNDNLTIICQMSRKDMSLSIKKRLMKSTELCSVLRRYWQVTSITMVAEGYCSMDADKTGNIELSKAFLDPSASVRECITVAHANAAEAVGRGGSIPLTTVAVPYSYEIGRNIAWGDMLIYPGGGQEKFRNAQFPEMLRKQLARKIVDDLPPEAFDELRRLMRINGFYAEDVA